VLVVDDDPDLRTLANMQLTPHGYDVVLAADGNECIRLASEKAPDVIVLDVMMPDMDGTEVLGELSSNPVTQDIPVIFLSARTSTEDRVRGLEGGALDYLPKPADPREFVARVGVAARSKARADELRVESGSDPVTKLATREDFTARLQKEVSRSSRSSAPFSILLIEIDEAADIGQRHGEVVRDTLMREVAGLLRTSLRISDELFRYADNEFAALLPDTELSTAFLAAERCREEIFGVLVAGRPTKMSIGVAQHVSGRSPNDLVSKAELALFRAKESGGGRSWRADDPRRHALNPLSLAEELTNREWEILYQLSHRRTEQEIAHKLGITRGTVRSHKARIRRKLHVAPDVRLAEFVKINFKGLMNRMPQGDGTSDGASTDGRNEAELLDG
jgi:diguanylate cyclase (GGDEF)-like protein